MGVRFFPDLLIRKGVCCCSCHLGVSKQGKNQTQYKIEGSRDKKVCLEFSSNHDTGSHSGTHTRSYAEVIINGHTTKKSL